MNRRKWLTIILCVSFSLCVIVIIVVLVLSGVTVQLGQKADFNNASLRWTIIGAIGSWAGSIFGAIALIVSLFALWLPQRVKFKISVSTGIMVSSLPRIDRIDAYIITVSNVGMSSVTVKNVYLHFGGKQNGDIFVGCLNRESILQDYTPILPKRLDQGESFDYYLLKDKLDAALAHYEENTPIGNTTEHSCG